MEYFQASILFCMEFLTEWSTSFWQFCFRFGTPNLTRFIIKETKLKPQFHSYDLEKLDDVFFVSKLKKKYATRFKFGSIFKTISKLTENNSINIYRNPSNLTHFHTRNKLTRNISNNLCKNTGPLKVYYTSEFYGKCTPLNLMGSVRL